MLTLNSGFLWRSKADLEHRVYLEEQEMGDLEHRVPLEEQELVDLENRVP